MSLIPMLLARARAASTQTAGPAGRHGYNPGHRHQPLAASLAFAVPAAIFVAYLLNPQILPPETIDDTFTVVNTRALPPPPPPPDPTVKPQPNPQQSVITAPTPPFTPPIAPANPVDPQPPIGPVTFDPGPVGPALDPPAPPKPVAEPVRTLAALDKRFADRFQPSYPGRELREEVEGKAKVRVLVGTDGRVKAVEDMGATSPGFFAETKQQALNKWRFKPATLDGTPVESWFTITVSFELKNV
jgi:protein TonB